MPTDYDNVGEDYLFTKVLPWKRYAERFTYFKAVGPVAGLRMIDVACGDGYYTRLFREQGAQIVGVDLSQEMIRLAREQEQREPLGIRYEVADGTNLEAFLEQTGLGEFDVSVSQWMFDYAATRELLQGMCRSLARATRPGGRFVHLGGCFDSLFNHPENFPRYGIQLEVLESHGDGSRIRWTVRGQDPSVAEQSVSAENTMWTPDTITAELEAAGFTDVAWPPAEVGDEGLAAVSEDYWPDFLKHPYFAVFSARRRTD